MINHHPADRENMSPPNREQPQSTPNSCWFLISNFLDLCLLSVRFPWNKKLQPLQSQPEFPAELHCVRVFIDGTSLSSAASTNCSVFRREHFCMETWYPSISGLHLSIPLPHLVHWAHSYPLEGTLISVCIVGPLLNSVPFPSHKAVLYLKSCSFGAQQPHPNCRYCSFFSFWDIAKQWMKGEGESFAFSN